MENQYKYFSYSTLIKKYKHMYLLYMNKIKTNIQLIKTRINHDPNRIKYTKYTKYTKLHVFF